MQRQPTVGTFLAAVLRRSLLSWHGGDAALTVATYAAILALPVLVSGVARPVFGETFEAALAILAASWLVLRIAVIAPYGMWRDAVAARDRLAARAAKRLSLTFKNEAPFVHRFESTSRHMYRFNIGVTNTSATESIENIDVRLSRIEGIPAFSQECSLMPFKGDMPFDLPPGGTRFVRLASWSTPRVPGQRSRVDSGLVRFYGDSDDAYYHAGDGIKRDREGRERIADIWLSLRSEDRPSLRGEQRGTPGRIPFGNHVLVVTAYAKDTPSTVWKVRTKRLPGWRITLEPVDSSDPACA
jgi:hypothetical protein